MILSHFCLLALVALCCRCSHALSFHQAVGDHNCFREEFPAGEALRLTWKVYSDPGPATKKLLVKVCMKMTGRGVEERIFFTTDSYTK